MKKESSTKRVRKWRRTHDVINLSTVLEPQAGALLERIRKHIKATSLDKKESTRTSIITRCIICGFEQLFSVTYTVAGNYLKSLASSTKRKKKGGGKK